MTDEIRRPGVLPLSVEWWTPEMLADELGKSAATVYRRFDELVSRGILKREKRCVWSSTDAQTIANYIAVVSVSRKKDATALREGCET